MNSAKKLYNYYKMKYLTSYWFYIIISSVLFFLSAIVVLLNLFTIKFNPGKDSDDPILKKEYIIFLSIAIITAFQGFIGAVTSLLALRNEISSLKSKNEALKEQLNEYKHELLDYKNNKSKDELLLKRAKDILI